MDERGLDMGFLPGTSLIGVTFPKRGFVLRSCMSITPHSESANKAGQQQTGSFHIAVHLC